MPLKQKVETMYSSLCKVAFFFLPQITEADESILGSWFQAGI